MKILAAILLAVVLLAAWWWASAHPPPRKRGSSARRAADDARDRGCCQLSTLSVESEPEPIPQPPDAPAQDEAAASVEVRVVDWASQAQVPYADVWHMDEEGGTANWTCRGTSAPRARSSRR